MNEHLKFSWGHIIAFIALITIGYITFMGVTYYTDGDFVSASISMVCVFILLFAVFIGAQFLKATHRKFARRIWIERIIVFSSPIIYILALIPFSHFWTVQSHDNEIVSQFSQSIDASRQLFNDYDSYSNKRISQYEDLLNSIISNKDSKQYSLFGFKNGKEYIQRDVMVKTLRLQLLSSNYDSLKVEATQWIDKASVGASTWNVFLLGNIKEIQNAISEWQGILADFSSKKLPNEELNGNTQIAFEETRLDNVITGLNGLKAKYTTPEYPNLPCIISAILLYFMLFFPYFLQDRHTKSMFRLIGMEGDNSSSGAEIRNRKKNKTLVEDSFVQSSPNEAETKNDDDEYAAF